MGLGQFTGPRSKFTYTNDVGDKVVLRLDATNVLAASALPLFNATNDAGAMGKPIRFKPRGVYWQATDPDFEGARKFLVCGSADATLYASNAPQAVTIDGVPGITTGRRGEIQSFV